MPGWKKAVAAVLDGNPEGRENRLASTVGEVMSAKVVVLSPDDTITTVQAIFAATAFQHLPVVDADGRIAGLVSDRDVLHAISSSRDNGDGKQSGDCGELRVGGIMTRNPVCVGTETSVLGAFWMMTARNVSCILVTDQESGKLLGILTWHDIVASASRQKTEETA